MTADSAPRPGRRKVLFLSYVYPSRRGSGPQIRAASLIAMLAADAEVYLLIAGNAEKLAGPPDATMEGCCRRIAYLRVLRGRGSGREWARMKMEVKPATVEAMDCEQSDTADRVVRFYREHGLESLFVFRFEALPFIYQRLDCFPSRELDLDELPSRRQAEVARVKANGDGKHAIWERRAQVATQVMEKAFLPRFDQVYVASAYEAEQVRRQTGFDRAQVLPNVYPVRRPLAEPRESEVREILFVGALFYPPNRDAVIYFCREILPLIRRSKGGGVLFRIVGMGSPEELNTLKEEAGVEVMGYQENLEPFYARASLVAVPLRAGAGTRLKILEAFAYGRAVVSTSIGCQGLDVTDREDILIADGAEAFAERCMELMEDRELAGRLGAAASRLQRERYSDEALLQCYRRMGVEELVAQ